MKKILPLFILAVIVALICVAIYNKNRAETPKGIPAVDEVQVYPPLDEPTKELPCETEDCKG